jgi:hypothetical protein
MPPCTIVLARIGGIGLLHVNGKFLRWTQTRFHKRESHEKEKKRDDAQRYTALALHATLGTFILANLVGTRGYETGHQKERGRVTFDA